MKKKLFIIDDDAIYRIIVSKMTNIIDSTLIINQAENGEIGLAKLEYMKNSNEMIIVLLDINMPILDGWGVLDQIEKNNFYNIDQFLIYIVSSSTDERDILKAKQYDFLKGFLHKPLKKEDIKSIIGIS